MIVNATDYLNLVIEHAANAAGVKYIGISHSLDSGKLCDKSQQYVNGASFIGGNEIQGSFHLNSRGHFMIEKAIVAAPGWGSNICNDGATLCPKAGEMPEMPDVPASLGGVAKNSRAETITDSIITKGTASGYSIASYTLGPDTTYTVTYHSNLTRVGTFTTNDKGGADITVTTPSTLAAGYHILTIEGTSYSGEPIELTQTVLVQGSNPNDRDENGIYDTQQPCGPFLPIVRAIQSNGNLNECDIVVGVHYNKDFRSQNNQKNLTLPYMLRDTNIVRAITPLNSGNNHGGNKDGADNKTDSAHGSLLTLNDNSWIPFYYVLGSFILVILIAALAHRRSKQ